MCIKKLLGIAVWVFLAFSLFTLQNASAVSFGSAQNKEHATINASDSAGFRLLFHNIYTPETVRIILESDVSPGFGQDRLKVKIKPKEFDLEYIPPTESPVQEEGYEFLVLPGLDGYVKAKVISVEIQTKENIAPGDYEVRIYAKTLNEAGTLATSLVRSFYFKVKVLGELKTPEHEELENIPEDITTEEASESQEGQTPNPETEPVQLENQYNGNGSQELNGFDRITGMLTQAEEGINKFLGSYQTLILIWFITLMITVPLYFFGKRK